MQVRDVMTADPYRLQLNDTVQHAAQEMKQHNVGALPVCDGERLAGIVTDRDIVIGCVAAGLDPDQCAVKDYMTANPICVSPEASAEEALRLMAREQIRRLCITEGDRIVGVLALGDLAATMAGGPTVAQTLANISEPVRAAQAARV